MSSRSRTGKKINNPSISVARDKPMLLTVTPVKYSLTEGTDIPPPPESPVKPTPPPTTTRPNGTSTGPLTSHRPTTPERKIPGAFPESDSEEDDRPITAQYKASSKMSPSSATAYTSSPPQQPVHRGVRKMFSLTSLRQSFSSSRTSLALPRQSTDVRPSTSRYDRPFTPSVDSVAGDSVRPRRSGWFKRKSSFFNLRGEADAEEESNSAYANKRLKSSYSVPLLPDISELAGGELDGGDLGWDATTFRRL